MENSIIKKLSHSEKRIELSRLIHVVISGVQKGLGEEQVDFDIDNYKGMFEHYKPEYTPEKQHQLWLDNKIAQGFKYGKKKDMKKKTHPCLVPYEDLPREQKIKDYIVCEILNQFYLDKE